ncbi:MAG TPA: substrate-binding domain-containing protein [Bryobacteraceae bacterium]|nr:substrate-binding domain-containing protein [Bryobacteraceae bacterium]
MTKTLAVTVFAALSLALTACSGSRHEATEKYYLVTVNTKIPYWQVAGQAFIRGAKTLGLQAEVVGPETYDPQAEVQEFKSAAAKKPSGILVSAADPNLMKEAIDSAIAQGIVVITIDSDSPASKRLTFIGTNNYQAGLMGGRLLAERLNGKGSVVVFTIPGQANLDERLQGYKNVLSAHPQIKITQIVDTKGDRRVAFDTTTEIVGKSSVPDAFVSLNSTSGQEIADVLDRHKVEGKIVIAMDTDADTLNWIKKGGIAATIAQKPFTMANFGILVADALHHFNLPALDGKFAQDTLSPVPLFIDTGATLVDKSNVDQFMKEQTSAGTN